MVLRQGDIQKYDSPVIVNCKKAKRSGDPKVEDVSTGANTANKARRRHSGELPEIADKVGLIEKAKTIGQLGEGSGRVVPELCYQAVDPDGALKPFGGDADLFLKALFEAAGLDGQAGRGQFGSRFGDLSDGGAEAVVWLFGSQPDDVFFDPVDPAGDGFFFYDLFYEQTDLGQAQVGKWQGEVGEQVHIRLPKPVGCPGVEFYAKKAERFSAKLHFCKMPDLSKYVCVVLV